MKNTKKRRGLGAHWLEQIIKNGKLLAWPTSLKTGANDLILNRVFHPLSLCARIQGQMCNFLHGGENPEQGKRMKINMSHHSFNILSRRYMTHCRV